MSCIIFWSCQPVQGHTVRALLITVLADEHVTVLGRKRTCLELLGAESQASDHFFCIYIFQKVLWTKLNQKSEHFCFWNTTVLNTPNPKIHLQMKEWHEELVTHLLLGHEFPAGFLELHPMLPRLISSGDCSLAHCRQRAQRVSNNSSWLLLPEVSWTAMEPGGQVWFPGWLYTLTVQHTGGHNTA